MKKAPPNVRLERLMDSLSAELAQCSDEEIQQICDELRFKLDMKGSLAFLGVKGLVFPYRYWVLPQPDEDPTQFPEPDDDDPPGVSRRQ
jgi:hypothetical protein